MNYRTADRLAHIHEYYFSRKLRELSQLREQGVDVINLGIGSPDLSPDNTVISKLSSESSVPGNHGYQSYIGIPELREAFAAWYQQQFGVELDPSNEILPLIGSKEGIVHVSMTYVQSGDVVLVPDPGYPSYSAASRLAGAEVATYDLLPDRGWLPDLQAVRDQDLSNVRLMWLNYPHMPTGARGGLKLFHELVSFASDHEILLCHDNPYAFISNDKPYSLFQVDGAKEVSVELTSLSKTFNMAGWRVGAMIGHSDRIKDVLKFKSNMDSGMFRPIQLAAVEALNLDRQWYQQINQTYKSRREHAEELLRSIGCQVDSAQVGMFVWARIPDQFEDAEGLSDLILATTGVFITPGHIFGRNGNKYLRVSLCTPIEVLESAQERCASSIELKSIV
ncbi:MAG: aminotransferase class I/II-fold pyridoxal phosphate-dependent enzyme [Saprospiraceae bacterium]|nr:aminotransferase class I/II-fold pyridoxal phosphate-dependent enzyme [Saprospiraceae bacterium]